MDGQADGQQRGSRVQVTVFGCGGIFISYLHGGRCPWCEMTFVIYMKQGQKVCVCVCVCVGLLNSYRLFLMIARNHRGLIPAALPVS